MELVRDSFVCNILMYNLAYKYSLDPDFNLILKILGLVCGFRLDHHLEFQLFGY